MLHKDTNTSFNTILTNIYFQKMMMCILLRRIPFFVEGDIFLNIYLQNIKIVFWTSQIWNRKSTN